MKLVTIDGREVAGRPGVLLDTGDILDLTAAPATLAESQWIPQSVVSILVAGDEGRARAQRLADAAQDAVESEESRLRETGALLPYKRTALMAPVRRPGLILIGTQLANGGGEPDPVAFIKGPNTVVGPGASVRPTGNGKTGLAGRGLLAAVLGKALHEGSVDEAAAAIAAYTLIIDLSMPTPSPDELQQAQAWRRYIDSKQFPGACPMGPAMVTADVMPAPERAVATTRINDVVVGQGPLWPSDYPVPGLLAKLSQRFGFRPGDLIAFEPSVGANENAEHRLQAGDTFSVSLDGIMNLSVEIE